MFALNNKKRITDNVEQSIDDDDREQLTNLTCDVKERALESGCL